ncbi:hypothetical protein [Trichloromonas sp.]|uniref:hypothetical protein n=1 Tax=Trichloromonas sp. TaxID=3069249 RepID=UPI002A430F0C|nr:hypothetical protein [Trichloromonas sp.]
MNDANIDETLCRQCGGRCCQGHPGVWTDPQRFFTIFATNQNPTAQELSKILKENRLVLRNLGGILVPAPRETEQGCAELGPKGCSFPPEKRPCQCLGLIPELETLLDDMIHCRLPPEYGSGTAREKWRPWQELLCKVNSLPD